MTAIWHRAILHAAALLVPAPERAEWLAEWQSELWYVSRRRVRFCLGAFRDALWMRRQAPAPDARMRGLDSPVRCLAFLALLAMISIYFAFRLPLPRELLLPSPYRDAGRLVMVSPSRHPAEQFPTVTRRQYYMLDALFPTSAYYAPRRETVQSVKLSLAMASTNLFDLLGLPVGGSRQGASLVLSSKAWKRYFHSDPHLIGRTLQVAGRAATVAAILPGDAWRLPGQFDAWLLNDEPPAEHVFVLAQLRSPSSGRWRITAETGDDQYERFECVSLAQANLILSSVLIGVVSLLVLSTLSPLALGEYPGRRQSRRWIFFLLKIALLSPVVCCGTLDLASFFAVHLEAQGLIVAWVLALRWALADQRRRCPTCLRVLSNPTRIGGLSHAFLEWSGTELMCGQGHGLLYVPEVANSCYSMPRWQQLDPSWSSLFT